MLKLKEKRIIRENSTYHFHIILYYIAALLKRYIYVGVNDFPKRDLDTYLTAIAGACDPPALPVSACAGAPA